MDQLIQKILEINPFIIFLALMLFAFCPVSCILLTKRINRWVKTVTVLVCGELSAVALFVLAKAAKTAGVSSILAEFTPFAVALGVLTLVCAIVGHLTNWEKTVKR